jgi:hypothetical protein
MQRRIIITKYESGRRLSSPISKYYSVIILERLRKTAEVLSQHVL